MVAVWRASPHVAAIRPYHLSYRICWMGSGSSPAWLELVTMGHQTLKVVDYRPLMPGNVHGVKLGHTKVSTTFEIWSVV
jgi:hypothetical protein